MWFITEVEFNPYEKEIVVAEGQISILDSDPACVAAITGSDDAGQPEPVVVDAGTSPAWAESSSGTVVAMTVATDGMSASFKPVAPGSANVTVSLQIGGKALVGVGTITVEAGEVTQIAISFIPGAAPAPAPAPAPVPDPTPGPMPAPVPDPAPSPASTTPTPDPATGLPLYTHASANLVDTTIWTQVTDVVAADGTPLFTFSGDSPGGTPNGVSADWAVYTGATEAPPAPTP